MQSVWCTQCIQADFGQMKMWNNFFFDAYGSTSHPHQLMFLGAFSFISQNALKQYLEKNAHSGFRLVVLSTNQPRLQRHSSCMKQYRDTQQILWLKPANVIFAWQKAWKNWKINVIHDKCFADYVIVEFATQCTWTQAGFFWKRFLRKYRRGKDPNIPQHREGKEGRQGWGQRLRTEWYKGKWEEEKGGGQWSGEWIEKQSGSAGKVVQAQWPAVLTQAALMHGKIMHKYVHLCI